MPRRRRDFRYIIHDFRKQRKISKALTIALGADGALTQAERRVVVAEQERLSGLIAAHWRYIDREMERESVPAEATDAGGPAASDVNELPAAVLHRSLESDPLSQVRLRRANNPL